MDASARVAPPRATPTRASFDAGVLAIGKVVANGAQVALVVATSRTLGPGARGVVVWVLVVVLLVTYAAAGLGALARRATAAGARHELASLGGATCLLAVAGGVTTTAVLAAADLAGAIDIDAATLSIGAALACASVAVLVMLDVAYGASRHRTVAAVEAGVNLAQVAAYGALALTTAVSPAIVLATYVAAYAAELSLLAGTTRAVPRPDLTLRPALANLRHGLPSSRQALSEFAVFRADRLVLGMTRSSTELGLYAAAATAAELLRLVPMAVGQVIAPRVSAGRYGWKDVWRAMMLTIGFTVVAATALVVGFDLFVADVLGPGFEPASRYVALLAAAEVALVAYQVQAYRLQAEGSFAAAARPAMWCAPLVVVADVFVIARVGPIGAAWVGLVAYAAMSVAMLRLSRRGR